MQIGIIGLGYWGPNLVRNFLAIEGVKKVLCTDINMNRLEAIKRKYPMIDITENNDNIIRAKELDAIVIATPVHTHYELAKSALNAGKHVLIEKPITRNTREIDELIEIAEKGKRTIMVDHTFIYSSPIQSIKKIIDSGEIGNVLYFDSVRINLGLFQPDVNVIWDLAPHDISILQYIAPHSPVAVSAIGMKHYYDLENLAYMSLHYENSMIAHFHVNWLAPVKLRQICIGGTKKMIYYDDMELSEKVRVYDKGVDISTKDSAYNLRIQYRSGDMYAPQIKNTEALSEMAKHFIDSIQSGTSPITDASAGREVVAILEAAEESLKNDGKKCYIK